MFIINFISYIEIMKIAVFLATYMLLWTIAAQLKLCQSHNFIEF